MKILYAIQGTGNGHLSRARDIIPLLQKKGAVDICVSGCQADVSLPYKIAYRFQGLSFIFGKKGGVDYFETYKRSNLKQLYAEIKALPVVDYDIVISDFEPVSAWACYLHNKSCIGLSHQLAVIHKKAPHPTKTDILGKAVLKFYAPVSQRYGFHFFAYDKNIFTPVIRREIRALAPTNKGHYTVYLPAYSDEKIIRVLSCFPEVEWQIFSKHTKLAYTIDHISVAPIENKRFIDSLASSEGILCGAGFETPAEALFLKKKLLVIPMKGQYEQQCNAAALKTMGVPVLKNLKTKQVKKINSWLQQEQVIPVSFPDETEQILELVIQSALTKKASDKPGKKHIDSSADFRNLVLQKIFKQLQAK